jgi:RNA polymerase nonessential primary-like sigma factor
MAYRQKHQQEPGDLELSEILNKPVTKIKKLLKIAEAVSDSEMPVDEETESSFIESLADNNAPDPETTLGNQEFSEKLDSLLSRLPERQREVVVKRYGLGKGSVEDGATLEEVGSDVGLTRERVRQIQVEALAKLRGMLEREGLDREALLKKD